MEEIETLKVIKEELLEEIKEIESNYESYSRNRNEYDQAQQRGLIEGLSLAERLIQNHIDNIYH